MSHPDGDRHAIRYHRGMSRWLLLSVVLSVAACSKSAGPQNQDNTAGGGDVGNGERIAVPGGAAPEGAPKGMGGGGEMTAQTTGGEDAFKLKPDEGRLQIEVPADAKAGAEVIAKVVVIPSDKYKVNKEFPTMLSLTPPAGVTLAKSEMKAGGADESKGDADALDDKQLVFSVKLTPQAGNHTIGGTFKFAVCDKDTCLAKKEQISIAVAAK
jgi:hypothetical protein